MIVGALTGATASGKSRMALEWAYQNNCEIISADSMQVYEGFAIGTAQPSAEDLAMVNHHLTGFLAPDQAFSAGDFLRALHKFHESEKQYLVVGGTGFYLVAMLNGMGSIEEISAENTQKAEDFIVERGVHAAFQFLQEKDPVFAGRIHPSDRYRLKRGLEVYFQTSKPYSSFLNAPKVGGMNIPLYSLELHTETLNQRTNARTIQMFEMGWVEEVKSLLKIHPSHARAFSVLGYAQILQLLNEELSLKDTIHSVQTLTRQLAKRQRTFLRGQLQQRIVIDNETAFKKNLKI